MRSLIRNFAVMGRIMAIDFGRKRCGVAATDPLRIVATGLGTVATSALNDYVKKYVAEEGVDAIVVGSPTNMNGQPSDSMRYITPALQRLKKVLPADLPLILYDERFTSVLAHRGMIDSGMSKTQRRDKGVVDTMAATIILNDYLQSRLYADNCPAKR